MAATKKPAPPAKKRPSIAPGPSLSPSAAIAGDEGGPPQGEHNQLPITSFTEWDKVGEVKSILRQLEIGEFRAPALLVDAMLRDDRIDGDLTTRINSLLGSPKNFQPARQNDRGRKISEQVGGTDNRPGLWDRIFPDSAVGDLLRWGIMLGIGVGELVWSTDEADGSWVPRMKVWHPQFLYWRWDTRSYWLITDPSKGAGAQADEELIRTSLVELPRTDKHVHSDGRWIIYTPYGFNYGWLRAKLRSLAQPWLIRQWTYRDAARSSETYGQGIRKAIVDASSSIADKKKHLGKVSRMNNETAILVERRADGTAVFDVDLLEAKARTWESFDLLIDRAEKSIAIGITGQDSSNRAQGGSLADFKGDIRVDYRRADAKIANVLAEQGLYWWSYFNHGDDGAWTPRPLYEVDPPEDEGEEAKALQAIGQALVYFDQAEAPLDVEAVLEESGLPILSPEDHAAKLAEKAERSTPPALAPFVGGPGGAPPPRPGAPPAPRPPLAAAPKLVALRDGRSAVALEYGGAGFELPDEHRAATVVPRGGASCANCLFLAGDRKSCTNEDYKAWNGGDARLLDPKTRKPVEPEEFCSDWWEDAQPDGVPVVKRYTFAGLPIAVENPAGTTRRWTDAGGKESGSTFMHFDYGFVEGARGADDEDLDVYVGPDEGAKNVFVMHQRKSPDFQAYDEDKVMLGFGSESEARAAYFAHRRAGEEKLEPGPLGEVSIIPIDRFKAKLRKRKGAGKIRASYVGGRVGESSLVELVDAHAGGTLVALRVVHRSDGWHVYSEDGKKHLGGPYPTKKEAVDRLAQVEYYKQHSSSSSNAAAAARSLAALAARAKVRPNSAGARRAKRYVDRLARTSAAAAREALAPDLKGIREAVAASKSFDELKKKLGKLFAGMDPKELAKIVERARILAHLDGRHDALRTL